MALNNLREYARVGLGTLLTSSGISHALKINISNQAAEEAMYRNLEVVNPETITNAYNQVQTYISNTPPSNISLFAIGSIVVGAGMLASGIYNLAKNFKEETKE